MVRRMKRSEGAFHLAGFVRVRLHRRQSERRAGQQGIAPGDFIVSNNQTFVMNMTKQNQTQPGGPRLDLPPKQGLYDPQFEKDACGVGFVAHIKGKKSHELVQQGLKILNNLDHRGACGAEVNTGDGAGILIQTPHEFLLEAAAGAGIKLPPAGQYGVGMFYVPQDVQERRNLEKLFEKMAERKLSELIDPQRRSLLAKRFWVV